MFSKSAVSLNGGNWDTETYSFPQGLLKPGCRADVTNSTKLSLLHNLSPLNAQEGWDLSARFSLGLPVEVGNGKKILFTMVTQ